jgi:hypothetical protein
VEEKTAKPAKPQPKKSHGKGKRKARKTVGKKAPVAAPVTAAPVAEPPKPEPVPQEPLREPAAPPAPPREAAPVVEATPLFPDPPPAAVSPEPAPQESPQEDSKDLAFSAGEATLSLLAALKEWEKEEEKITASSRAWQESPIPPRPQWQPREETFPGSPAWEPEPQRPAPLQKAGSIVELRLVISRPWLLLGGICLACAVALGIFVLSQYKMRDLEGLRLPDPSSPTMEPATQNDPFPELKAPTRPQRN